MVIGLAVIGNGGSSSWKAAPKNQNQTEEVMGRPTKDLITSRLSDLKSHYSQRNVNFDLDDKYYELQFRDDLGYQKSIRKMV